MEKGGKVCFKSPAVQVFWHLALFSSTVQITGEYLGTTPIMMLKPVPIICLIIVTHLEKNRSPGLWLSLLGDVLLMYPSTESFMMGTLAFLLAHLAYITVFFSRRGRHIPQSVQRNIVVVGTLIVTYYCYQLFSLWNKTPSKLLYINYGAILSTMMISAMLTYHTIDIGCESNGVATASNFKNQKYWCRVGGALSFGFSDNLIAYLRFNNIRDTRFQALIMLTYYIGQILITNGVLLSNRIVEKQREIYEYQKLKQLDQEQTQIEK